MSFRLVSNWVTLNDIERRNSSNRRVISPNSVDFGVDYVKVVDWQYIRNTIWVWWSGVVVSTLALINEVNLRRTRLVLRWITVSGSIPGAGHLFQYVTNQPPKANSAFHPSRVGKWVPASARKAKAGMVHSVSGWTRGAQVKLWDPLRTVPYLSALEVRSRRGAIQIHVYRLPLQYIPIHSAAEI